MPVTFDSEAPVKARLAIAEVGFGQGLGSQITMPSSDGLPMAKVLTKL